MCPGCIGRGGGEHCCMCSLPIPVELQRPNGQPAYEGDVYNPDCLDCAAGAFHTHRAGA